MGMGMFLNLTDKDIPVKESGKKRNYNHITTATNNSKVGACSLGKVLFVSIVRERSRITAASHNNVETTDRRSLASAQWFNLSASSALLSAVTVR